MGGETLVTPTGPQNPMPGFPEERCEVRVSPLDALPAFHLSLGPLPQLCMYVSFCDDLVNVFLFQETSTAERAGPFGLLPSVAPAPHPLPGA